MELIYAIAAYLDVPNEYIIIDKVVGNLCMFHVSKNGASYYCKLVRNGKYLKKNSIRKDV